MVEKLTAQMRESLTHADIFTKNPLSLEISKGKKAEVVDILWLTY